MEAQWTLERHSGRRDGDFLLLFVGSEMEARKRYDQILSTAPQRGAVRILRPDGSVKSSVNAAAWLGSW